MFPCDYTVDKLGSLHARLKHFVLNLSPTPTPVASACIVMGLFMLIISLLLLPSFCGGFVLGPCFIDQYLVSFLVLLSSRWEERAGFF